MLEKTLEQLENDYWEEPSYSSHLVTECHRLRKVPLKEFSIEHYRLLLGQNIGTPYLLPLAIKVLQKDPLSEGDFYPGDLLKSVITLPTDTWKDKALGGELQKLLNIIEEITQIPKEIETELSRFLEITRR